MAVNNIERRLAIFAQYFLKSREMGHFPCSIFLCALFRIRFTFVFTPKNSLRTPTLKTASALLRRRLLWLTFKGNPSLTEGESVKDAST